MAYTKFYLRGGNDMIKILKRTFSILLITIFFINLFDCRMPKAYASGTEKYLVLLEWEKGKYDGYTNMVEKDSKTEEFMAKASVLGYLLCESFYNYNNGTFEVKYGDNLYYSFAIGSDKCTVTNIKTSYNPPDWLKSDEFLVRINPDYLTKTTTTRTDKLKAKVYKSKSTGFNMIPINSLSYPFKYFKATKEYKDKGYTGILMYSDVYSSTNEYKLPKYKSIQTITNSNKLAPREIPERNLDGTYPAPNPASQGTTICGVFFPKRDIFLYEVEADAAWGVNNVSLLELEDVVYGGVSESTALYLEPNVITYTHVGGSGSAIKLIKVTDGYEITISVSLNASKFKDKDDKAVANENSLILKGFCYLISSSPEELYKAIYNSWSVDDTYGGINEKTFVTIGDSKVKYQKGGTYIIVPAK